MKTEAEQKAEQLISEYVGGTDDIFRDAIAAALREAQGQEQTALADIGRLMAEIDEWEGDNDELRAEVAKLKAERDAALGKPYTNIIQKEMLRDEFVRGLERAKEIALTWPFYEGRSVAEKTAVAIQAEIDKAKAVKP